MLSLTLGPLSLPLAPVLLLLAVWGASGLAGRLAGRPRDAGADETQAARERARAASDALIHAAWFGLLAARLMHLALNADLYAAAPLSALDLRDGGWHAPGGALAGAAWLLWHGRQAPELRRALAAGTLAGLALWSVATLATRAPRETPLPALALTALDSGETVDLAAAARGRPVVVNLWASWCGPCRAEMPLLAAAQQRERDIGFLFVNQGESAATVRAYLDAQGLTLQEVLLDTRSALGPAVGSRGLPTTLFYDARGRRIDAHVGVLNAAALESRLRALRAAP